MSNISGVSSSYAAYANLYQNTNGAKKPAPADPQAQGSPSPAPAAPKVANAPTAGGDLDHDGDSR